DEREHEVQPRVERAAEAPEPLDDARTRLRNDPHRLHEHDQDDGDHDEDDDQRYHAYQASRWTTARLYSSERRPSAADRAALDARLGDGRWGGGGPRERHAVRRAAHIVEPQPVAEGDRARLAAVLPADTRLQRRLLPAPALDRDPHQLAHAPLVDRLERIAL